MSGFKQKYEIIPRYLTGPSKRRPCISMQGVRFMVAHDTGNPGSTAANNVSYYERSRDADYASAQIFVDDKEIIECIPFLTAEPEKAWHVVYNTPIDNQLYGADANDAAGGVELCYGGNIDINESYRRFVWVLAYSCYKYGLDPARDITGHYIIDPTRKVDPKNTLQLLGKSFEDFITDVVMEYNECLEDDENMAIQADDWFWKQAYNILGTSYNEGKIDWSWCQKVLDRTLTAAEYTHVIAVIMAKAKGINVDADNPAALDPSKRLRNAPQ